MHIVNIWTTLDVCIPHIYEVGKHPLKNWNKGTDFPKLPVGIEHHNHKTKVVVSKLVFHPCSGPAALLLLEDLRYNFLGFSQ